MQLTIRGIPTVDTEKFRNGGIDANGQRPLQTIATGGRNPCRHCLQPIANGDEMLVLAYRPFESLHPYAETGPIFLHRKTCKRYVANCLPDWFDHLTPALVRGYGQDHVIRYETGGVVNGSALAKSCEQIFLNADVSYVHIRSKFNCFQCRVDRG